MRSEREVGSFSALHSSIRNQDLGLCTFSLPCIYSTRLQCCSIVCGRSSTDTNNRCTTPDWQSDSFSRRQTVSRNKPMFSCSSNKGSLFPTIKSASEAARSRPSSTDSFQIRANTNDDVFASTEGYGANPVHQPFEDQEDGIDNHDMQLTLIDANPVSIDAQGIYPPTACIFAAK